MEENMGKILIVIGVAFFLSGTLLLSTFTSLQSLTFLYCGVAMALIGFLMQLEIVTSNYTLRQRIGALIILFSVFFFSGSFISIVYTEMGEYFIRPAEDSFLLRIKIVHPSAMYAGFLFFVALALFTLGFLIKYK
jgi:hypothetical protein